MDGIGQDDNTSDDAYEDYWRNRSVLLARAKDAKTALQLLEKGDEDALQKQITEKADTIAAEARDASAPRERRLDFQKKLVAECAKAAQAPPIPPRAMVPRDVDKPADEHIRVSGRFADKGERVKRGFLRVVSDVKADIPEAASGRLELARWLTDTKDGAGHLAARVLANRIWHHLMGRGLVRTVDNFGRTGEAPSHPELLDHLARELIASGWSIKSLVRQIVLSHTFTMSSQHSAAAHEIDPGNRLLWRANRRRLDPETLRDAMLLAAGTLDRTPMNSSVWYLGDQATAVGPNKNRRRTDFPNRSVYLPVIRNDLPEVFDVFDFADPQRTTGSRPQTLVATQGLFILNDESVMTASESTARRVLREVPDNEEARVIRMYELIVNTPPSAVERQEIIDFVTAMKNQPVVAAGDDNSPRSAGEVKVWALAAHALFASSRFQIVE